MPPGRAFCSAADRAVRVDRVLDPILVTRELTHGRSTIACERRQRRGCEVIEIECAWCEAQLQVEIAQLEAEIRCEECQVAWSVRDRADETLPAAA